MDWTPVTNAISFAANVSFSVALLFSLFVRPILIPISTPLPKVTIPVSSTSTAASITLPLMAGQNQVNRTLVCSQCHLTQNITISLDTITMINDSGFKKMTWAFSVKDTSAANQYVCFSDLQISDSAGNAPATPTGAALCSTGNNISLNPDSSPIQVTATFTFWPSRGQVYTLKCTASSADNIAARQTVGFDFVSFAGQ